MKLKLFISASLSTPEQRKRNLEVATELEALCEVYLPQRDGGLFINMIEDGESWERAAKHVFESDINALANADVALVLSDDGPVGGGASFEIGYAYSKSIPIWMLRESDKVSLRSPILETAVDRYHSSVADIISKLSKDNE